MRAIIYLLATVMLTASCTSNHDYNAEERVKWERIGKYVWIGCDHVYGHLLYGYAGRTITVVPNGCEKR